MSDDRYCHERGEQHDFDTVRGRINAARHCRNCSCISLDWDDDEDVEPEPITTRVLVPGEMIAYYEDGEIRKWVFIPSESDAGYFGPTTSILSGDPLDVEDQDGPFWDAVRGSFTYEDSGRGPCKFTAEWEV